MSLNTFTPASVDLNPSGLPQLTPSSHIIVVGAGAFGGWTALSLLRKGIKTTLIDAWGAGNLKSSSGDETRIIRTTYGENEFYFNLARRSLKLWKDHEMQWNKKFFINSGALWFCYDEVTPMIDDSLPMARKNGLDLLYLSKNELARKYPQINTEDLHHGFLDPFAGYLKARESCLAVHSAFVKEGGQYIVSTVKPGPISAGAMGGMKLSNGDSLKADAYLFACGAWMGQVFPEVLGDVITSTRQEVYYMETPATLSHAMGNHPVWVDVDGTNFFYGIPEASRFKIGIDRRGAPFDPTVGGDVPTPEILQQTRQFLAHRFPAMKDAPLMETRICPYENSPDGNFIFQMHPEADNVILLGGGSGHGFKHGPGLGEWVCGKLVIDNR